MGLLAFFRKKPANAQPNGEDNALTEIHADISQMDAVELPMAQIAAFWRWNGYYAVISPYRDKLNE